LNNKSHIERLTNEQLQKSIKSHEKSMMEHRDKIDNPTKYIQDYTKWSALKQNGMREYWRKEIVNMQKQVSIAKNELNRRRGRDG
jgi:hypothetical protein